MKPYYQDDAVTIFHGDCRELLPLMPKVDLVLTDPPYGLARIWHGGGSNGWGPARGKTESRNEWDQEAPDLTFLLALNVPTVIWGGNFFSLPPSRGWLIWRKEPNPEFTLGEAELAWTNRDKVIRVYDLPRSKLTGRLVPEHPTQKPLPLMLT